MATWTPWMQETYNGDESKLWDAYKEVELKGFGEPEKQVGIQGF